MKAEIIAQASQYCSGFGKEFQIVSTQDTQSPYILGDYVPGVLVSIERDAEQKDDSQKGMQPSP